MTWSKLRIIRCMSFPIVLDSCWQSVPSLLLKSPTDAESKKEISCINDSIHVNKFCHQLAPKENPSRENISFSLIQDENSRAILPIYLRIRTKFTISTWIRRTPYRVSLRRFTCKEAISWKITLVKQALQLLQHFHLIKEAINCFWKVETRKECK